MKHVVNVSFYLKKNETKEDGRCPVMARLPIATFFKPLTLPKHYLIRDMFLFSCYTGIPYGDMRRLADEDISIAEERKVWIKRHEKRQGLIMVSLCCNSLCKY